MKELAAELEKQRRTNDAKGKKVATDEAQMAQETSGQSLLFTDDYNQEALDEMCALNYVILFICSCESLKGSVWL